MDLKRKICAKTGIPSEMQELLSSDSSTSTLPPPPFTDVAETSTENDSIMEEGNEEDQVNSKVQTESSSGPEDFFLCNNPVKLEALFGSRVFIDRRESAYEVTSLDGFASVAALKSDVALVSGKWQFEVVLHTAKCMQIGWIKDGFSCSSSDGTGVGDDVHSWAFDGYRLSKWHGDSPDRAYGRRFKNGTWRPWKSGDVLGCLVDCDAGTISYCLNGEFLGSAFESIDVGSGLRPGFSLSRFQHVTFLSSTLLHPVEGYLPISEWLPPPPPSSTSLSSLPSASSTSVSTPQTVEAATEVELLPSSSSESTLAMSEVTSTSTTTSSLEEDTHHENGTIYVSVHDDSTVQQEQEKCLNDATEIQERAEVLPPVHVESVIAEIEEVEDEVTTPPPVFAEEIAKIHELGFVDSDEDLRQLLESVNGDINAAVILLFERSV